MAKFNSTTVDYNLLEILISIRTGRGEGRGGRGRYVPRGLAQHLFSSVRRDILVSPEISRNVSKLVVLERNEILLYAKLEDVSRVISTAKLKGHDGALYPLASRQTGRQTLFTRESRRDYGDGKETSFLVAEYSRR